VTGRPVATDTLALRGMRHRALLRSPMAHARSTHIDVTSARALPGVLDVFTGRDVADMQGLMPCVWPVPEDTVLPDYPPLAINEVRHTGEPVAVVAARDAASALDALETIDIDYDPLPVVLD